MFSPHIREADGLIIERAHAYLKQPKASRQQPLSFQPMHASPQKL
jgi:hypothetical protein